jgi:hypothetical protein
MGRTVLSATDIWNTYEESLQKFRRALRISDQKALDQLCVKARQHLAAASYAASLLPMETFLLSMLLELEKENLQLKNRIEKLEMNNENNRLDP